MLEIEIIRQRLGAVFCKVFNLESVELSDGMTARDIKKWNSLSNIRLMISVEKEFGVRFSAAEVERLKNVGDLIQAIQSKASNP